MEDVKLIGLSHIVRGANLYYCPKCKQVYYNESVCKKCMTFDWVESIERKSK